MAKGNKEGQVIEVLSNLDIPQEIDRFGDILKQLVKTNIDEIKPKERTEWHLGDDPAQATIDFAKNAGAKLLDGLSEIVTDVLIDQPMTVISNLGNVAQNFSIGIQKVINPYIEVGKSIKDSIQAAANLNLSGSGSNVSLNKLDKLSAGLDLLIAELDKTASKIDNASKAVDNLDYPFPVDGKDDIVKLITASDAMSNMFDVFFVFENDESEGPASLPVLTSIPEVYNKNAITPTILSTRIKSISIPQIDRATTTTSFCGTTIEKPDNIMNDPHQSSFEIMADDRLFYVRMFNKLSGTDFSNLEEWNELANKQLETLLGEKARIVTGEMSTLYNSKMDKLFDNSRGKLSIYVKRLYHMPIQEIYKDHKSIFSNPGFQTNLPRGFKAKRGENANTFPNIMDFSSTSDTENNLYSSTGFYMPVYFKFTDVKILGTGGAISFKREGANTQNFTYDFIYRQCLALEGK